MVKRREEKRVSEESKFQKDLENFASGAEGDSQKASIELNDKSNRYAPRNFKQIRVTFNEYEYQQLEKGAKLTGLSKLSFIRRAILELTSKIEKE